MHLDIFSVKREKNKTNAVVILNVWIKWFYSVEMKNADTFHFFLVILGIWYRGQLLKNASNVVIYTFMMIHLDD